VPADLHVYSCVKVIDIDVKYILLFITDSYSLLITDVVVDVRPLFTFNIKTFHEALV